MANHVSGLQWAETAVPRSFARFVKEGQRRLIAVQQSLYEGSAFLFPTICTNSTNSEDEATIGDRV